MKSLTAEHGRLLVNRHEFRWIPNTRHVICVGRVARAVNCGAIETRLIELTAAEVEAAASFGYDAEAALFGHRYEVKAYAMAMTATTAKIPLLVYETSGGALVLLDGRQRAAKALTMQAGGSVPSFIKAYCVSDQDAFSTGQHPSLAEFVELWNLIKDPIAAASLKDVLRPIASMSLFTPVVAHVTAALEERAQAGHPVAGAEIIAEALGILTARSIETEPPTLLPVTMKRPIVFESRFRSERAFRKVMAFSASNTRYRPKDDRREKRVVDHYRFYSLELVLLEEIIAARHRIPPFENDESLRLDLRWTKRKGVPWTEERRRACDAYLRAHWQAISLDGKASKVGGGSELNPLRARKLGQYLGYDTTDKNAAQVIKNSGRDEDVGTMRRRLVAEIDAMVQRRDWEGLRDCRDRAVTRCRLYAKAYVRLRQWEIGKKALVGMENGHRPGLPKLSSIEAAARWDLDAKPSLVDFAEMLDFSLSCGLAATDVWPTFLEFNPLFECCAFIYNCKHQNRLGEPQVTPTMVEFYVHRLAICDQGEIDGMSELWSDIQARFQKLDQTRDVMAGYLAEIDKRQGLDKFPMM